MRVRDRWTIGLHRQWRATIAASLLLGCAPLLPPTARADSPPPEAHTAKNERVASFVVRGSNGFRIKVVAFLSLNPPYCLLVDGRFCPIWNP